MNLLKEKNDLKKKKKKKKKHEGFYTHMHLNKTCFSKRMLIWLTFTSATS